MVIREAVRFGEGYLYLKEADTEDEITYYAKWTNRYKEARGYLYGTAESEADEEAAYEIMLEEAEAGNAYAMHDMGKIYAQGIRGTGKQRTGRRMVWKITEHIASLGRNTGKGVPGISDRQDVPVWAWNRREPEGSCAVVS